MHFEKSGSVRDIKMMASLLSIFYRIILLGCLVFFVFNNKIILVMKKWTEEIFWWHIRRIRRKANLMVLVIINLKIMTIQISPFFLIFIDLAHDSA